MRAAGWLLLAILVIAAPIIAEAPRAAMRLRLVAEPAPVADSVTMVARFRLTVDARGDTVAGYLWRFFSGRAPRRVMLLRGYVRLDTLALEAGRVVLRWRAAKPVAGDSIWYSYSLRAVDRGGIPSAEVYSGYSLIAWPPANPAIYPWNYDSLTAYIIGGVRVGNSDAELPITFTYITETVQICYLAWYGGNAETPRFRVAGQSSDSSARTIAPWPQRSDCLAVTAVRP